MPPNFLVQNQGHGQSFGQIHENFQIDPQNCTPDSMIGAKAKTKKFQLRGNPSSGNRRSVGNG